MDSKSIEWFVSYQIPEVTGDTVYIVGPYHAEDIASYIALDISRFGGAANVKFYTENADELLKEKLLLEA